MNVKIVTGVYELALLARMKDSGMEKYCKELEVALAPLTMPAVLAQFENPMEVYAYAYWDAKIPGYKMRCFEYPTELSKYEEMQLSVPQSEIQFLDHETNHNLFGEVNFQHPNYHELKAHMLIRDCFFKFLSGRVKQSRMDETGKIYKILHDSSLLNAEELEEEISIVEEAVMVYIAETMNKRYNFDAKQLHLYCYEMLLKHNHGVPNCWNHEMLEAISIPRRVSEQIEANDFSLSCYSSKICPNLKADVARFVHQAYDLIYSVI